MLKAAHGHEAGEQVVQSITISTIFRPGAFGTKQNPARSSGQAILALLEHIVFYQIPVRRTTSRRLYFEIFGQASLCESLAEWRRVCASSFKGVGGRALPAE
jgi:hypothetical protein